jgi:hypothetical protein
MEASIIDLRYKMKDVLCALERKEEVTILYRGKVKGTIMPAGANSAMDVRKHPFFGSSPADGGSIAEEMEKLRGGRFGAL